MKNDFEEILEEFLKQQTWDSLNYDFIKNWVDKSDGLIAIDGVTLSVFNKHPYFTLILWIGELAMKFSADTLPCVVHKSLLYLNRATYEQNKTTV